MKYMLLLILTFTQVLGALTRVYSWFCCSGLKLISLSRVIPNNLTVSDDFNGFSIERHTSFSMLLYFERNLSWNFDGLATISLSLSHFVAAFVSSSNLMEMSSKYFQQAYKIVFDHRVIDIYFFQKKKQPIDKDIKKGLLQVSISKESILWCGQG